MKVKFYLSGAMLFFLLISASVFAAPPTVPASNVNFSYIDGASLRVNWTSGNGAQRLVIAKMGGPVTATPANGVDYLSNGAFGSGFQIAPNEYVVGKTSFVNADITALQPNTVYYFAVFEFNGSGASTQYIATSATGNTSTLAAPTTPSSNISFSNVIGNSVKISWTNGNGSGRMVVMKQGSAVDANPVDLTYYSYATSFGSGPQIGSGNYIVYNGANATNNVTVTNLNPSTTYYVKVFESNGSSNPVFLTTTPAAGTVTTLSAPTVAASNISFAYTEGNSMRVSWTQGNGTNRIVIARAGAPVDAVPVNGVDYLTGTSAPFNTAPEISLGQKVIYDYNSSFVDLTGLSPNTIYYFKIFEYDGTGSSIGYLTSGAPGSSSSTLVAPTTQASAVTFTNITATTMKVNWVNGNGNSRIVLAKAGAPVNASPADLAYYNASSNFGNGTQIGSGNYVVYNGAGNNVNLTNLGVGVTYHFAVFEYNGNAAPVYLTSLTGTGSQGTTDRPTVPSGNLAYSYIDGASLRLNWTPGNGAGRIIVARADSQVDAVPVDGVDYLATGGSAFNTAPEISPGQKVIYDNNGSVDDLSGLNPSTIYYFRIYEYDGTGSAIKYLTSSSCTGNSSTVSAPSVAAGGLSISNISGNSMQVNWVNGNGAGRIVLAKAGAPVDATPADLISYNSSSSFGYGTQIGSGNYVVSGGGNTVNLTNLLLNTTYHFAVFEYNGSSNPVYLTTNPGRSSATTAAHPTVPSSSISSSYIEGNSMRLQWNPGNGTNRIIVARAGSPVDAVPANGVDYLTGTSAPFNTAPEISLGQKLIYDNNGSFTDITGLSPNTVYYFKIFEYDGSGSSIGYLTTSTASASVSTANDPSLQATAVSFTSVTANSMLISWTPGNGEGRMVVMRQGNAVNNDPVDLASYSASSGFGTGGQIGAGNYVVFNNTSNSATVTGLVAGTTYHVAIYEYNGTYSPMYLTPGVTGQVTTIGPPTVPASNAVSSAVTGSSVQLSWTNGSGNRRIVLMHKGSAVDAVPVNNVHYSANSFFGSGTQIGTNNYVVFDGTQNNVSVTNLQPANTYYFSVFEYNDFGATTQVLASNPATGNFATGALPVTLINFEGIAEKDHTSLSWSTAQEHNSAYFDIERSNNGIDFTKAGSIAAKGESNTRVNYVFKDNKPFDGDNYYRLKQVDKDGSKTYSFIVHVRYNAERLVRKMINPVGNTLLLELFKQLPQGTLAIVYDINGQVIRKQSITSAKIEMDISSLPGGTYLLSIYSGSKTEQLKFVKR